MKTKGGEGEVSSLSKRKILEILRKVLKHDSVLSGGQM